VGTTPAPRVADRAGPIITRQIPMENFAEGFRLMQSGEGIKVVMDVG